MKSTPLVRSALMGFLGLSACFGNPTWTAGEWAVSEYQIADPDSSPGYFDECGLVAHLRSLEGDALSYTLSEPPDRSDPDYHPDNFSFVEPAEITTQPSGELTAEDIATGQADLFSLCSTPSPRFYCNFAIEMLHTDKWLEDFATNACEEGWSYEVHSNQTDGLILNANELLTRSHFSMRCVNDETGEEKSDCESTYSTRLRPKSAE